MSDQCSINSVKLGVLFVCNKCLDFLMMCVNFGDAAILNIKGSNYCCIISLISKNEAINLLQNSDFT